MDHRDIEAIKLTKLPNRMLVEITFFGPMLPDRGESAIYPRAEVKAWVDKWVND